MNGTSEWREHIQQIKEGGEKFTTAIPDSRAVLENLSSEIDKSLDKIMKKMNQNQTLIQALKRKQKMTAQVYFLVILVKKNGKENLKKYL